MSYKDSRRAIRSGSWYSVLQIKRVTQRVAWDPDGCGCGLGFRLVSNM